MEKGAKGFCPPTQGRVRFIDAIKERLVGAALELLLTVVLVAVVIDSFQFSHDHFDILIVSRGIVLAAEVVVEKEGD